MAATALVQARIDQDVKERATEVLAGMGISVSDAVRILLTRTAKEGHLPFQMVSSEQEYDSWFRAKVQEALDDPRPRISNEEAKAKFAKRRAAALAKA